MTLVIIVLAALAFSHFQGIALSKLTSKRRNALPAKSFAGPDRSYPVEDASHARNALARVSQHGTEALKEKVRAAVKRKFPGISQDS